MKGSYLGWTRVMVAAIAMTMLLPCLFAIPVWAGDTDEQNSSNDSADLGVGTVPSAPRNLVADKGPGFVWLWWDHPSNQGTDLIKNYSIYRGIESDGSDASKIATLTVGPNSSTGTNFYNDTHLENGTIYYYRMTADSDAGSSAFSNVTVTPSAIGSAPTGPQNLNAQNGIYTVQVNWTAPASSGSSPVRFYDIYREENGELTSFFNDPSMELWTTGYFDDDNDLLPGHLYNYTVRAINTYGAGASIDVVNLGGSGDIPGIPQNLTATGWDAEIDLSWDPPVNPSQYGITKFNIYRNETGSSVLSLYNSTTNDMYLDLFFTDSSVVNGINYKYQVTSVNDNGESGRSNEANATPELPTPTPYTPHYLEAYPGDGQVLLRWPTVFYNVTGYEIFWSETSNGQGGTPNATIDATIGNDYVLWYDNETTNGVTYYYKVKIVSFDAYEGPFSEEASATPGPGTPPVAPTELIVTPFYGGPLLIIPNEIVDDAILWYEIYRANSPGGPDFVRIENSTEFSYDTGLFYMDWHTDESTTYFYKVKAVNMYGGSPFSNENSSFGSSSGDVPDSVTDLVATAGTNKITVTWNNPEYQGTANLLTYILTRNNGSGWTWADYRSVGVGPQSYDDTSVDSGVTYQYQVWVSNFYGPAFIGSNIDSDSIVITPTAPSEPLNLVAEAGSNYVNLTWDPPSDSGSSVITGYTVLRGPSDTTISTVLVTTTTGNILTFNDTTADNGNTYWYAVKAKNSVGTGPASDSVSASPVAVQTAPSKPLGLVAAQGNAQVILTWSAPSSTGGAAITNYDIFRGYGSGNISTTALVSVTMPGNLTYTDSSALNGVDYWYVVTAVNSKGSSPFSEAAHATPSATGTVPGAPTTPTAVGYQGSNLISWGAPSNVGSGVSSYQIFRATTPGGQGSTPLATIAGSALQYNDTSAVPGTPYYYKIRGVNPYGNGALSTEVNATASSTGVPTIPTNLAATPDGGKIILTWDVPTSDGGSAITGYKVLRGANASSLTQIGTTDATKRSYTDEEVTEGQTYYYAVMAVNANGNGSQPTPVSAVPEASGDDGGSDNTWLYVGAGVAAVAVIGGLAYFLMRKKP